MFGEVFLYLLVREIDFVFLRLFRFGFVGLFIIVSRGMRNFFKVYVFFF